MNKKELIEKINNSDGVYKYFFVEEFFKNGGTIYSSVSKRTFKFLGIKDHGNTKRIEFERSGTFARFEITAEKLAGRLMKGSWGIKTVGKKIEFKIKSKDD